MHSFLHMNVQINLIIFTPNDCLMRHCGMQQNFSLYTMENSMEVPQKTKNRITMWYGNLTPGHIPRENRTSKRYMHPYLLWR